MDIAIDRLVPHPANPNRMSEEIFNKLKGHIGRTGRYEAVVVRPLKSGLRDQVSGGGLADTGHLTPDTRYQILNGHHRLRALKELGHTTARCDVWEVDDAEALVLVATLNRLAGEDVPAKREALLAQLLGRFDLPRLADLVPESRDDLEELARSIAPPPVPEPAAPEDFEPVEFLTFALTPAQRLVVDEALKRTGLRDRAEALLAIAEAYELTRIHHRDTEDAENARRTEEAARGQGKKSTGAQKGPGFGC